MMRAGQRIVYLRHEHVGHFGIFVSADMVRPWAPGHPVPRRLQTVQHRIVRVVSNALLLRRWTGSKPPIFSSQRFDSDVR